MHEIKNKIRSKIIKILMEKYPITLDQIIEKTKIREDTIKEEIKRMEKEGIVELQHLPDKIFVRLLRSDFIFLHEKFMKKKIKIKEEKDKNKKNVKYEQKDNITYI